MTVKRKTLGRQGEAAAAQYLSRNGLKILCRNYTCPLGEIDLIATEDDVLVFVEVRSRSGVLFGMPQESITSRKQNKLRQLAWYYLKATGQANNTNCRFDVVAVLMDKANRVEQLEHFTNAF